MAQRISSPIFVGREAELRRVAELRARAASDGHGETVLVTGEAGIGKSRFCAEVASRARSECWAVLRGSCDEFGAEARPFAALADMVGEIESALREFLPEEFNRPPWAALDVLRSPAAPGHSPSKPGSIAHLTLDLFRRMAAHRPLLVLLDDLHWADESTCLLFSTLAQGLASSPALLIAAFRADEMRRGHPLRPFLGAVHRKGAPETMELVPFVASEARELAQLLGRDANLSNLDEIIARSGGNAFLLEELLATPAGSLPRGVQDLVFARLDTLNPDALQMAESLALDTVCTHEQLAGTVDLPWQRFAAALDAVSESGLIARGTDDHIYRHALIREVVYDRIPPGRRRLLHRRRAESLERSPSGSFGELARHWLAAGVPAKALAALVKAGNHAANVGATPEAALHYEHALALWDSVAEAETATSITRDELAGHTLLALESCRKFERAIELTRARLASGELSREAQAFHWLHLSRQLWYSAGDVRRNFRESQAALRRAMDLLDEEIDPAAEVVVLAQVVQRLILNFGLDNEGRAAWERIRRAEPHAKLSPFQRTLVLEAGSIVHMAFGDEKAVGFLDEWSGWTNYIGRPFLGGVRVFPTLGLHERNIEESAAAADAAFERGQGPVIGFQAEAHLARSFAALGRWKESLDRLNRTRDRLGKDTIDEWADLTWDGWGAILARTGAVDELRRLLTIWDSWFVPCVRDETPDWLMGSWALANVELARAGSEFHAARNTVNEVIDIVRGHCAASCAEPVAYAIGLEADVAFDLRDPGAEALAAADHWITRLETCLEEAPGRARIFDLGLFIDQALAERARLAGADEPARWERLAKRWHDLPRPYHEAYCRYRAAFALLMTPAAPNRRESRERAAGHLEAALTISNELGAVYLQADTERLLQTARIRVYRALPPAPPRQEDGLPQLTSREIEVLRLLVAGESNGRIAIRLGISVKTASVHVSNILRKLDAGNRVEAAVRASRMLMAELNGR